MSLASEATDTIFKGKIYLPGNLSLIPFILRGIHGRSHEGYFKTLHRLRGLFYWTKMKDTIRQFILECHTCQRHKADLQGSIALLEPLPIPTQVWIDISMDFLDGLAISKAKTILLVWWTASPNMRISFRCLILTRQPP